MRKWLVKFCFFITPLFLSGMLLADETPQYLYKILSWSHWQATQKGKVLVLPAEDLAGIYLTKEERPEQMLPRGASQFVIVKIDTAKLQGELNEEKNGDGFLYKGWIPFYAIVEARMIFQNPPSLPCKDLLSLGHPTLRQNARKLSKTEVLSPEIQHLIEEMKETMRNAPGVGLAAPQIGESIQLVVIEDMDHAHLTKEQLIERERQKVPFHVLINPQIFVEGEEVAEFFEGCLSVPEMMAIVPRAKAVRVECWNEKAEPVVIHARGWYARILQHEIDHLQGTLYIDRSLLPTLMTEENGVKLWKGKKIEEVKAGLM